MVKGVIMNFDDKKQRAGEIAEILKTFPDGLQEKVFDYLTRDDGGQSFAISEVVLESNVEQEVKVQGQVEARKIGSPKKVTNTSYQPQFVRDLNLRPNDKKTLADFFKEKNPSGNIENTAVIVYYLKETMGIDVVTPDHIYTCYRELGVKIPAVLPQNLRDCASNRYGFIDFKNGVLSTNIRGINFVEQDLPKKK